MIFSWTENLEPEALRCYFNNPGGVPLDDNSEQLRFMVYMPIYMQPQRAAMYRYTDLQEFLDDYEKTRKEGKPDHLPFFTDKVVFETVVYQGKEYHDIHTFNDVVSFAIEQKEKEKADKREIPSAVSRIGYELYKMDWLNKADQSVRRIALKEYYYECERNGFEGSFDEYTAEYGDGDINYLYFEEFLQTVYPEESYMKELFYNFGHNKGHWDKYLEDMYMKDIKRYEPVEKSNPPQISGEKYDLEEDMDR